MMGYAFVLFLDSEYTGAYLASIGTFRRYVPRLTKSIYSQIVSVTSGYYRWSQGNAITGARISAFAPTFRIGAAVLSLILSRLRLFFGHSGKI